ncbi:hypothetical protein [Streptomyces sp. NPDC056661]|uniref:hypothetical protein n=1 Tax=Streptomyces sp. NPDC056661 TaxID=3345898 RepID=UPI00367905BC
MGPGATLDEDPWETWSQQQIGTVVAPWLERYLDTHRDLPQDDPDNAATGLNDEDWDDEDWDDEDWDEPVTPMNRDTLSYLSQELYVDEGEGPPEHAQRLATLISRLG